MSWTVLQKSKLKQSNHFEKYLSVNLVDQHDVHVDIQQEQLWIEPNLSSQEHATEYLNVSD